MGASGALGRAAATRMAREGARRGLALFDRRPERLEGLVDELQLPKEDYLLDAVDLGDPDAAMTAAEAVVKKFGKVDILLNLVGGKPVTEVLAYDVSRMLQQHV